MLNTLAIFFAEAQEVAQPAKDNPMSGPYFMIQMLVVCGAFWYFFLYMPSKRERTRQANLFASIKKNDHVLTTSGIFGVVTDVSKETNKVTLRIDETTNAKLRVTLNSIAQVLGPEASAETPSK